MNGLREVSQGIFLLELPLPFPRLPIVNVYLIRDRDELGMVDCGMNVGGAFDALSAYLDHLGCSFKQIRQVIVTHNHPDHIGLSGPIRDASGANVVLHRDDAAVLPSRYVSVDQILADMRAFLALHGAPEEEVPELTEASLRVRAFVSACRPGTEVTGGEAINVGDTRLELVWTPGHTAGHVVVYEPHRKLLFSGDHLLWKITPNVSKHPQSTLDPLHDFERSLQAVAAYDVVQTLPAHGPLGGRPAERVDELLAHHRARRQTCLDAIGSGAMSAWDVSRLMFPKVGAIYEQRMALFETLAHLEALKAEGRVAEETNEGRARWRIKNSKSRIQNERETAAAR
ncbi:MAG: MBL fold metallo-hydrolase [Chloroflexota bacterium]|nr:MBL fold metallo-hydrolase [Chloroflexota bacterium]